MLYILGSYWFSIDILYFFLFSFEILKFTIFQEFIMSVQFFPKLSQNYIEILEDDEYYDVTIEVGSDPNVKIFRAHMIILCYRSPFLRRTLASNKKNEDRKSVV